MKPLYAGAVIKLIFVVYSYLLMMATASVVNCELKHWARDSCSSEWTQTFTLAGGTATTLWAYITDNPTQDNQKQPIRKTPTRRMPVRKTRTNRSASRKNGLSE